jgi:hypothetical protein
MRQTYIHTHIYTHFQGDVTHIVGKIHTLETQDSDSDSDSVKPMPNDAESEQSMFSPSTAVSERDVDNSADTPSSESALPDVVAPQQDRYTENVAIAALKNVLLGGSRGTPESPEGSNNAQMNSDSGKQGADETQNAGSNRVLDALRDVIIQAAKRIQNTDAHEEPQLTSSQISSDSESGHKSIGQNIVVDQKKPRTLLSGTVVAAMKDDLMHEAPPWTSDKTYRRYSRGKDGVLAHWNTGECAWTCMHTHVDSV